MVVTSEQNILPSEDGSGDIIAVTVARGDKSAMELFSLVLLSVNISHRVIHAGAGWRVDVSPSDLTAARDHLAKFDEENRGWPPLTREAPLESGQGWSLLVLLLGLTLFHALTGPWRADNSWFIRGAVDSDLVLHHGEFWRIVTGLTLHADVSHLLGNVILGGLVLSYLAGQTGGGGIWLLALMTGVLGNFLNALYRGGDHRFVGFSTAVFGVIGCLCGLRMMNLQAFRLRSILLPLGAGAGLLAMLGTEGEKTDVGAHLWGLGVGVVCGLLWHGLVGRSLVIGRRGQLGMVVGTLLVILWSWWLAYRS